MKESQLTNIMLQDCN